MIQLPKGYVINLHHDQYFLGKSIQTVDKKGKLLYQVHDAGCHETLSQAILEFIRLEQLAVVRDSNMTLGEAIERFSLITQDVIEALAHHLSFQAGDPTGS